MVLRRTNASEKGPCFVNVRKSLFAIRHLGFKQHPLRSEVALGQAIGLPTVLH